MSIVLVARSLLADGRVTGLDANVANMALIGMTAGYLTALAYPLLAVVFAAPLG